MAAWAPHLDGGVGDRSLRDDFIYVTMALKADLLSFAGEHLRKRRAMGVMARRAPAGEGRMHGLLFQHVRHVEMTAEAQLLVFLQQQRLVVGLVRAVAGGAASGGDGPMEHLEVHMIRMARPTQFLLRLHQKLGLIRGVRVVTGGAHAPRDGEMHEFLFPERLVTHVAELGRVLGELEGGGAFFWMRRRDGLVTTLAAFRNGMHGRTREHFRVALPGDTALLRAGHRGCQQATAREECRKHQARAKSPLIHAPIPSCASTSHRYEVLSWATP